MRAPLMRIETHSSLPASAEVVVVGGGIVGTCTAYYLAKRGADVVLLEKGQIGAEQSSRNWGWCCQPLRPVILGLGQGCQLLTFRGSRTWAKAF